MPMGDPLFPSLYQINTRVWLQELGQAQGRVATLDQIPEEALDQIAALRFDWVGLLGIWQTGPAGRAVSRSRPDWVREFHLLLPDLKEVDISGSPFAVQCYTVHRDFGGNDALLHLRQCLRQRGVRLLLDFVPNHTAPDHPWVQEHPEYYIHLPEAELTRAPQNCCRVQTPSGPRVLAHGRDPYFDGWPDTLQLNYRHAGLRAAQVEQLKQVAGLCDGVRCDMAMLLLPDVIARTWGDASRPADGSAPVDTSFWQEAIPRVREQFPHFLFVAEAYWDLEWTLQQQGFDYTYDKRLYDRLHARDVEGVRLHLGAEREFQRKSVRFLENHDEPRAAGAFPPQVHRAAAVMAYVVPGMRFFHEGQLEGRRTRISMHLGRRPVELVDTVLQEFYRGLLRCVHRPEVRDGRWQLQDCRPAWIENPTWARFLAFTWEGNSTGNSGNSSGGSRLLIVVNYGPTQGQCYVNLPSGNLRGKKVVLRDLLSSAHYERSGDDLAARGLYVDIPEWGYHVFEATTF
jgi:hypothetical protein